MNPLILFLKLNYYLKKLNRKKFPYPSIGIGSITMGGSGKTPLVMEIIDFLTKNNIRCALLSRGYKRKIKKRYIFLKDDNFDVKEVGDEPFLIHKKFNIPLGIHKDRLKAAKGISEIYKNLIFILDDAMQIKKYFFDINIYVLEEKNLFKGEKFFPEGLFRDFKKEILDSDFVIINTKLKKIKNKKIVFLDRRKVHYYFSNYEFLGFYNSEGKRVKLRINSPVILLTGIASPDSLKNFILKFFNLKKHFKFMDHHFYSEKEIMKIIEFKNKNRCDYIITTEKDLVRIPVLKEEFVFPRIRIKIKEDFFDKIYKKVIKITQE